MSYTVFSCPRAMEDVHLLRQTNAILSWLNMEPKPEVLLMGDDPGVSEFAKTHGCQNVPVKRNDYGTPLVNDIFKQGQLASSNTVMVYINADIIVEPHLGQVLLNVHNNFRDHTFFMVGRRWDMKVEEYINFEDKRWPEILMAQCRASGGYLRNHGAIDAFGFHNPCLFFKEMEDFAVGRSGWDNWIVSKALQRGLNVVETTAAVNMFHQNIPARLIGKAIRTPEQLYNREIYHRTKGPHSGTTKQSQWIYDGKEFKRR